MVVNSNTVLLVSGYSLSQNRVFSSGWTKGFVNAVLDDRLTGRFGEICEFRVVYSGTTWHEHNLIEEQLRMLRRIPLRNMTCQSIYDQKQAALILK